MSRPDALHRARIMVMLGSIEPDRATLETLSLLADRTSVEILGRFVDIELLSLAELPIAREYCRLTHLERRLHMPDIERQFRVRARAARQALAEIAARFGSPLSFQTVRGELPILLREALEETDLMLFGAVRGALRMLDQPALTHAARPSRQPVTVVYDGSDAARRALQVALQLGQNGSSPVCVILTAMRPEDLPSLSGHGNPPGGWRCRATGGIDKSRLARGAGSRTRTAQRCTCYRHQRGAPAGRESGAAAQRPQLRDRPRRIGRRIPRPLPRCPGRASPAPGLTNPTEIAAFGLLQ